MNLKACLRLVLLAAFFIAFSTADADARRNSKSDIIIGLIFLVANWAKNRYDIGGKLFWKGAALCTVRNPVKNTSKP